MSHSQELGAKVCRFELSGASNIYVCPRDEYCCNIGCCISPTFQFYQLWYYWFMVFFMFLVCSGGQWWYRYMMQGRCASAIAPPVRRSSYPRQARVAYTPARDTVVLHHLWKPSYPGTGINGPPPSYSQSGTSSSDGCSAGGPKPSLYMQLYGPPPSYESVIGAGPALIHGPQASEGPSHNQTSELGRTNASHHLQPLDLHRATAGLVQHQASDQLTPQQPHISQQLPSRTQSQPRLAQQTPSLTQTQPRLVQQTPRLTQPQPLLAQQTPSLLQTQPRLAQQTPSLTQPQPLLAQQTSSLTQPQPLLAQKTTSLAQLQPRLAQQTPSLTEPLPCLVQQTPNHTQPQLYLAQQSPSFAKQPPSHAEEHSGLAHQDDAQALHQHTSLPVPQSELSPVLPLPPPPSSSISSMNPSQIPQ